MTSQPTYRTPDERYIVVRGRLWRASNPNLTTAERETLTHDLMAARREVRSADDRSGTVLTCRAASR